MHDFYIKEMGAERLLGSSNLISRHHELDCGQEVVQDQEDKLRKQSQDDSRNHEANCCQNFPSQVNCSDSAVTDAGELSKVAQPHSVNWLKYGRVLNQAAYDGENTDNLCLFADIPYRINSLTMRNGEPGRALTHNVTSKGEGSRHKVTILYVASDAPAHMRKRGALIAKKRIDEYLGRQNKMDIKCETDEIRNASIEAVRSMELKCAVGAVVSDLVDVVLNTGEEERQIQLACDSVYNKVYGSVEYKKHFNIRKSEFEKRIKSTHPTVFHFGGHGNEDGELLVHDDKISTQELCKVVKSAKGYVKLVILASCHSAKIAEAIALDNQGMMTIGTKGVVADKVILAFIGALYAGILAGTEISRAFKEANRKNGNDKFVLYHSSNVGEEGIVLRDIRELNKKERDDSVAEKALSNKEMALGVKRRDTKDNNKMVCIPRNYMIHGDNENRKIDSDNKVSTKQTPNDSSANTIAHDDIGNHSNAQIKPLGCLSSDSMTGWHNR